MTDHSALLVRFQPQLRYDSNEAFFADSAAEWTDNPGNVLRRTEGDQPGEVIAATAPGTGPAQLSLAFLGASEYGSGQPVDEDALSAATRTFELNGAAPDPRLIWRVWLNQALLDLPRRCKVRGTGGAFLVRV